MRELPTFFKPDVNVIAAKSGEKVDSWSESTPMNHAVFFSRAASAAPLPALPATPQIISALLSLIMDKPYSLAIAVST